MKKKVIFLTLIVAVLFMVLSMASFAESRIRDNFCDETGKTYYHQGQNWNSPGQFKGYPYNQGTSNFRGMMNLNLSAEQQDQIRQIMLDFQKETLELRNQIQVKQLELRELRLADEIDMGQIKSKLEEIASLQVELRMKTIERQENIKGILTPEQLENCGKYNLMQKFNMGNNEFRPSFKRSYKDRW